MSNDDPVSEAMRLIQAGNKPAARAILEPYLRQNVNDILAWIWEAELYDSDRDKIQIFEACLHYNPGEPKILQAMSFLKQRMESTQTPVAPPFSYTPEPAASSYYYSSADEPFVAQETPVEAASDKGHARSEVGEVKSVKGRQKSARKKSSSLLKFFAALMGILLLLGLVGGYVAGGYYFNGQINVAFAVENCDAALQNSTLISLYPRDLFGSLFNGYGQYDECTIYQSFTREAAARNWETALFYVRQYSSMYPNGVFAARMTAQAPDMHFKWAQEIIDKGGYIAGVDKLNELIELYQNSEQAHAAPDVMLQAYLAWAQEAIDAQEYSDAEARLQTALSDFEADATRIEPIKQKLVEVYIAWGDKQIELGDIENGIARYRMAGELSPGAVDADLLAARAYLERAIEIASREDYERAIQKVQEIIDTAVSDSVRAEANIAMEDVLTLYSQSSSLQAVDRITSAVTQVCQGQLPSLPALFGRADAPVRFGVVNFNLQLPVDWGAQTPGQLHYVLCITEDQDTIQSCPYQGGHTLYRVRYIWRVKLLDVHTGEQRDSESFSGSDPEACQQKESFPRGSSTKTKFGARPGVEEILAWLASLGLTQ